MNMRKKGNKGNWPGKFRKGLSLALCASMAGTGIAAHVAFADTESVVMGDELLKATPDQAERLEEATPSNEGMSGDSSGGNSGGSTGGGSGVISEPEATPSNATPSNAAFQMLPPDDNILNVGPQESYQSIQAAINYINEKQKNSDEAREEDWMIQVKPGSYSRFLVPRSVENLTIQGSGNDTVIQTLDGSSFESSAGSDRGSDANGIVVWGKNITFKDLKIESGDYHLGKNGKDLWYTSAISTNDIMSGTGEEAASGLTLDHCTFEGSGTGMGVLPLRSVFTVTDCQFDGYEQAIYFACDNLEVLDWQITGNTIEDCTYAIHGYFGGNVSGDAEGMVIQGNTISGTQDRFAVVALMDQSNKGSMKVDISDNDFSYAILGGINQRKDGDVAQGSMGKLLYANEMKDHSFVADAYWYSNDNYGTAFYAPKEAGKIAVWHADPLAESGMKDKFQQALEDYGTAGQFIELNAPAQETFTLAKNALVIEDYVDAGDLKISKQVLGNDHDNTTFSFTVKLSREDGRALNGHYDYVDAAGETHTAALENGAMTISVKNGESVVVKDLLPGTKYEVSEAENSAYTASCAAPSGQIEAKVEKEVVFQNTYQGSGLPDIPSPDWSISKSKTAEPLDKDFQSKVTLSLPAYDYKPAVDVVMVVDVSSSMKDPDIKEAKKAALAMCEELESRDKVSARIGIVTFDKTAHNLTNGLVSVAEAKKAIEGIETSSDTNMMAGLMAGKAMLDQGTADDKYLVLLSDGIPIYWVNDQGEAASKTLHIFTELDGNGQPAPTEERAAGSEPEGSATDMSTVKSIDEILAFPDWNQDSDDWYLNGNTGVTWENGYHYTNIEKSIYMTAKYMMSEILGRYPLKMVAFGTDKYQNNVVYKYGENFCDWIGAQDGVSYYKVKKPGYGGETGELVQAFEEISNEMIHVVDAGSSVIDEIGKTGDYDFAFVNDAAKLVMNVDGKTEAAEKIGENTYGFVKNDQVADGYEFVLYYHPDGCSYKGKTYGESFVWKINVPVTIDHPVQLTYQVKLTNPKTEAGTYGTYDRDGKAGYEGLYTNNTAILYPVDSDGNAYEPEEFLKPTVSYTVKSEKPDPTEPAPTEPEPTEPEPTKPEPTKPEPTEPQPTTPEPTTPQPTAPSNNHTGGIGGHGSRGSGIGGPGVETLAAETVPETTVPETAAEELPKTGDHTSPTMWLFLIGAGMAASLFVATSGRRDEE